MPFRSTQRFAQEDFPDASFSRGIWPDRHHMWAIVGETTVVAYDLVTKELDPSRTVLINPREQTFISFNGIYGLSGDIGNDGHVRVFYTYKRESRRGSGPNDPRERFSRLSNFGAVGGGVRNDLNNVGGFVGGPSQPLGLWRGNGITLATGVGRRTVGGIALDDEQQNPYGVWSDGITVWVSDTVARKLFAYTLQPFARDPAKDFDTLISADNLNPSSITSDGRVMWVQDNTARKIFAYAGPPPTIYRYNGNTPIVAEYSGNTILPAGYNGNRRLY